MLDKRIEEVLTILDKPDEEVHALLRGVPPVLGEISEIVEECLKASTQPRRAEDLADLVARLYLATGVRKETNEAHWYLRGIMMRHEAWFKRYRTSEAVRVARMSVPLMDAPLPW